MDHSAQIVLASRNACQLSYRCLLLKFIKGNYLEVLPTFLTTNICSWVKNEIVSILLTYVNA